jgi:hypothetical protein
MIWFFKYFKVTVNGRFKSNSPNIYLSTHVGHDTAHAFLPVTPDATVPIDPGLTLYYNASEPSLRQEPKTQTSTVTGRSGRTNRNTLTPMWIYTSNSPYAYMAECLIIKHGDNFTFYLYLTPKR